MMREKRSKEPLPKLKQRRSRVKTLQGAIDKNLIELVYMAILKKNITIL
jgi:hypothetical protein